MKSTGGGDTSGGSLVRPPNDPKTLAEMGITKDQSSNLVTRCYQVAKIYPEPEKGGRGKKKADNNYQVSRQYIDHARTISQYAPDLSKNVLNGSQPPVKGCLSGLSLERQG